MKNIRTKKRANYSECHDDRSFVSMTGCDGHLSSEQAVKDKTGYTSIILNHLWSKQSPHLDEFRPARVLRGATGEARFGLPRLG